MGPKGRTNPAPREGLLPEQPTQVDSFLRRRIRLQAGRLAGLRPPPARAPAFREGVNVLFSGTEEIQKVHAHVFAGFANGKQDQIFLNAFHRGQSPDDIPYCAESLDGVFGIVVVPRNAVVTEECEQLVTVLLKALLALDRRL